MSEQTELPAGPGHRVVEIIVALLILGFGLVVIGGSLNVGIGWAFDGPRAGFFPFYVGLLIVAASIVNAIQAFSIGSDRLFADWSQLSQVMAVVIPSAVYVALVPWLGIYVCSILLIAVFMKWLGRYNWSTTGLVSLGVPVLLFIVFEKWFLVPLPKGPVEDFLGY